MMVTVFPGERYAGRRCDLIANEKQSHYHQYKPSAPLNQEPVFRVIDKKKGPVSSWSRGFEENGARPGHFILLRPHLNRLQLCPRPRI